MQHNAEFAPGWLRAQIRESINELKADPRFSHELELFSKTEKQVGQSTLFRRENEDASGEANEMPTASAVR